MTATVANALFESFQISCAATTKRSVGTKAETASLPRINLRKRSAVKGTKNRDHGANSNEFKILPTVNSAFLSGLFADVAVASSHDDDDNEPHAEPPHHVVESEPEEPRPLKKSRLSLARSISRCAKSFANLAEQETICQVSPTGVTEIFSEVSSDAPRLPLMKSSDSLHFQLNCVSPTETAATTTLTPGYVIHKAGELVFPHLPATVSNSSCSTLTRNLSDLQSSLAENENKESYGWFVVTDEVQSFRATVDPYANTTKLAFEAPTAPHADNQEAEVEWAQAADTVDDVLGDFF